MSMIQRLTGILLIALCAGAVVVAQPPAEPPAGVLPPPLPGAGPEVVPNGGPRWLRRDSVMTVNPGRDGPIGQEVAVFTGPSIPIGGGILSGQMTAGWMVDLRARAIAFNEARSAAWVVDYGLGYIYDWQSSNAPVFTLFNLPVRVEELHRFYAALGAGREWYIYDSAVTGQPGTNFRFGIDTGGRWGGMRANIRTTFPDPANNFMRRYDVTGTVYWGTHLDYQVNMGAWTWFGGVRTEYSLMFSDILPGFNSNLQDLNLLLTTGIRY